MKRAIEILIMMTICFTAIGQEEQITFQSENLTLHGTLSIPENGNSPFPLAILVHGSGPNDRNQTITLSGGNSQCLYPNLLNQTIRNFKDIADHLSEKGIAVLRYDKRTFTHGQTLNASEILVSDFVIDIESAISFGKSRSEIDVNNIFLIGHSQGSSLIPIAANNATGIKGLISHAGATTPIDSLLPEQIRYLYEECANDPTTGDNVANQFYQQFEQIRNGTFPLDQQVMLTIPGNPNPIPQGYGSFWEDWIQISDDVLNNYSRSNLKYLIIQGDEDFNVPVNDASEFASISNAEIKIYEGINHYLTPNNSNIVSNEILNDITNWINSCLTTSTEDIGKNESLINVYRNGWEIIIESDIVCAGCQVNIYSIDGKLINSKSMFGVYDSIQVGVDEALKVVEVKGDRINFSQIIR